MNQTLTIRLDAKQRRALRARAAAEGKSESEIVRALIDSQLQRRGTVGERAGRYLGRLDFARGSADSDPWRSHLRRTNVRS